MRTDVLHDDALMLGVLPLPPLSKPSVVRARGARGLFVHRGERHVTYCIWVGQPISLTWSRKNLAATFPDSLGPRRTPKRTSTCLRRYLQHLIFRSIPT